MTKEHRAKSRTDARTTTVTTTTPMGKKPKGGCLDRNGGKDGLLIPFRLHADIFEEIFPELDADSVGVSKRLYDTYLRDSRPAEEHPDADDTTSPQERFRRMLTFARIKVLLSDICDPDNIGCPNPVCIGTVSHDGVNLIVASVRLRRLMLLLEDEKRVLTKAWVQKWLAGSNDQTA
ncbi:MAG: hypothetical protein JXR37_04475 [Kiritimatiellae bacterium]|nr:hypothetical protein [Kiritimatiellia bacterium]